MDAAVKSIMPGDIWQDTVRQLLLMPGNDKVCQRLRNSEVMEMKGDTWVIGVEGSTAVINDSLAHYVSTAVGRTITLEFVPLVPPRLAASAFASRPGFSPEVAWRATLGELELQMTKATFNTWLKDAILIEEHEGLYRIGVKNEYAKDWLSNRLDDTIRRTLAAVIGRDVRMEYIVLLDVETSPAAAQTPVHGQWTQQEWEEIQQVVSARQNGHGNGNGKPPGKSGGGGQGKKNGRAPRPPGQSPPAENDVPIRYRNIRPPTDPLGGFVKLTHYANRFWRPYLGQQTFALLEIISGFSYEIKVLHKPGPSLKLLAEILQCDPHDLAGRKGSGDQEKGTYRPGKYGYLNVLRDHHLCHHHTEGKGRGQVQYFDYLTEVDNLPLLTPKQVEKLSPLLQDIHWEWLKLHTAVNVDEWLADERETAIPALPLGELLEKAA